MRLLITGASGQLGRSLQRAFAGDEVVALSHVDLDITDAATVTAAVRDAAAAAVIHCAALTDTARCEKEPALARQINGIGSENVAKACRTTGARLVAISTNEVFAGTKREPYVESDATGPLNAYALSKLDGEVLAAAACPDTLIVRVSWLYGDGYLNFNEKVIDAAKAGRKLSFVTDEVAGPTSTEDVAMGLRALLEQQAPPGIYHLAGQGEASRYDWAVEILRLAEMADVPVDRVTMAELRANGYAGPVKPPYSMLANTRAAALGITLPPWRDALAAYFERARNGRRWLTCRPSRSSSSTTTAARSSMRSAHRSARSSIQTGGLIVIDSGSSDGSCRPDRGGVPGGDDRCAADENVGFAAGVNIPFDRNLDARRDSTCCSSTTTPTSRQTSCRRWSRPRTTTRSSCRRSSTRDDHRLISTHAGGFDWRLGVFRDTFAGKPDGPATSVRRDDLATASFCCALVPVQAFRDAGRLDERFFMYYEETDWHPPRAQATATASATNLRP